MTQQATGLVYIDSSKALRTAVAKLNKKLTEPRAIDTETTGDRLFVDRLKVIQIAVAGLPAYVIQIERIPETDWESLREYLAENCPSILQNAKFDLIMLAAEGFQLGGEIRDTLLTSRCIHLGKRDISHDLASLVLGHLNIPLSKEEQTSFIGDESREPLTGEQRHYCAGDVIHLNAVRRKLEAVAREKAQKDPQLLTQIERENVFVKSLADLELNGFKLDESAIDSLRVKIEQNLSDSHEPDTPLLESAGL